MPGRVASTGPPRARARVLTLGLTHDPYRGVGQGGLKVNKSGSQGLEALYPPMLRVLNPFLA